MVAGWGSESSGHVTWGGMNDSGKTRWEGRERALGLEYGDRTNWWFRTLP